MPSNSLTNFFPAGSTVSLTAGTSTGNVALTTLGTVGGDVEVYNAGSVISFITFGTSSSVTAALATSMPIAPGRSRVFTLPPTITHAAAITASSTAVTYFTTGSGT